MSLTDEERRIVVGLEIEKARKIVGQTDELSKLAYWDNIANRLYYAVFHAVSALLIRDGHKVSTHKGAVLSFGQHYVKTGIMSIDDARLYSQLQTIREKSDYNCAYEISKDEIVPKISQTKALISKIESIINKKNNTSILPQ